MAPLSAEREPMKQLFGYVPTLTGYEVIDNATGRPMGFERETVASANGIAQSLNRAALAGPRELARALRAT